MKSLIVKRSIMIAGHKTSVSLEDAFWKSLGEIAIARHARLTDLVASIDSGRRQQGQSNLSSAIRLFVLCHYQVGSNGHHGVGQTLHEIIVSLPPAHQPPDKSSNLA